MENTLENLINVYALSTGRRLFALGQVELAAKERGFKELGLLCREAVEHDEKTRSLETTWAEPSTGTTELQRTDFQVDRTLVAIRDTAQAQADGAEDGDEATRNKVTRFNNYIFPRGVQAITQATYIDELSQVDEVLVRLKSKEMTALATELGLTKLIKQLTRLAADYRAALQAPEARKLDFGVIRAARAQGHQYLVRAVAMILGKHNSPSDEDVEARDALLTPILKQNEAVRQYMKARRQIQDVNPKTGELDPNAPATDPLAPASPDTKSPA